METAKEETKKSFSSFLINNWWLWLLVVAFIIFLIVLVLFFNNTYNQERSNVPTITDIVTEPFESSNNDPELQAAIDAGKMLSGNNCEGTGPITIGTSPMKPEDFSILIPYGLMIGGHVTPIDHQYFEPADRSLGKDSYEVLAIADGTITEIGSRDSFQGGEEYRMVFTYTCTFFSYFDLVTSLSPEIKEEYDRKKGNGGYAGGLDIDVKEGQVIGRIGGQTLDYAVWDTEKPLTGFIVPEHYEREFWKIYTADPFDYYTEELKTFLLSRSIRSVEPIAGKIDYDIDGKLIGNWFVEGTKGYEGILPDYYSSHLSIVPEHIDPETIIVSIGDFDGEPFQAAVKGNSPDPAKVDMGTGLVKYQLIEYSYVEPDGSFWDRMSLVKGLKIVEGQQTKGIILLEMIGDRRLKVETFPNKTAAQVTGFTSGAEIYER
ncbi:MAG TPA: hypothetical protein ENI23_08605 [bacterium]|nr:hypothetical protein [bacterium]